ncbi:UbiA family prenyltransferase [Nocardia sp. NPDC058058]|uniref:UbiA family prenyltransferase n=1 Tax=Nocardia sp. NPDC058058 TaxID=3346317 RepID=UPI0036DC9609
MTASQFSGIPHAAWTDYLCALAAWFLATVHVYLLNGIADSVNDRVNEVGRPVGRGELDPRDAATAAWVIAAAALGLAVFVGLTMTVLVIAFLALGYAYSMPPFRLSRTWAGSGVIVTLGGLCTYLAGAVATGAPRTADLIVFAVAMSLWMGLVGAVVKDFSDVAGDRAAHRRVLTLLVGEMRLRTSISVAAAAVAGGLAIGAYHLPVLEYPCAVVIFGAAMVIGNTLTTRYRDPRPVSRRPYRAFMITQMAANAGAVLSVLPV